VKRPDEPMRSVVLVCSKHGCEAKLRWRSKIHKYSNGKGMWCCGRRLFKSFWTGRWERCGRFLAVPSPGRHR
jgi:hypothetical protein